MPPATRVPQPSLQDSDFARLPAATQHSALPVRVASVCLCHRGCCGVCRTHLVATARGPAMPAHRGRSGIVVRASAPTTAHRLSVRYPYPQWRPQPVQSPRPSQISKVAPENSALRQWWRSGRRGQTANRCAPDRSKLVQPVTLLLRRP